MKGWRVNRCQQRRKRSVSIINYRIFQKNRAEKSLGFEARRRQGFLLVWRRGQHISESRMERKVITGTEHYLKEPVVDRSHSGNKRKPMNV